MNFCWTLTKATFFIEGFDIGLSTACIAIAKNFITGPISTKNIHGSDARNIFVANLLPQTTFSLEIAAITSTILQIAFFE